jgi:rhodanese-related sulfurtransferase
MMQMTLRLNGYWKVYPWAPGMSPHDGASSGAEMPGGIGGWRRRASHA